MNNTLCSLSALYIIKTRRNNTCIYAIWQHQPALVAIVASYIVYLLLIGHEVVPPLYQRWVVMVPNVLKVLDAALQHIGSSL
jgi:hypothetical protein